MKSIIVLCGGYSKRMGQDKGLMLFNNKPLVIRVLEMACEYADEVILVLRDQEQSKHYENILGEHDFSGKIKICTDELEGQGPLMGIYKGLKSIGSDEALIFPCDSPFVQRSFIENIFKYYNIIYDAVVPEWPDGKLEPLHAIYNKRIINYIDKLLKDDKHDVQSLLLQLDVRYVPVYSLDQSKRTFLNLNYPEDVDDLK